MIISNRGKIILAGIAVLVIVLGIILYVVLRSEAVPNSEQLANQAGNSMNGSLSVKSGNRLVINADNQPAAITKDTAPVLDEQQQSEINLERLATDFASRFGSYSTTNNYENIRDLQLFMTTEVKTWSEKYITQEKAKNKDSVVMGITTQGLATKIQELTDNSATVVVSTQRIKTAQSAAGPEITYQDLLLKFSKQGDSWLVSWIEWQTPRL
ncbi:MAG: hypothetical protein WC480_02120 [Patescibacteria group bacterium]